MAHRRFVRYGAVLAAVAITAIACSSGGRGANPATSSSAATGASAQATTTKFGDLASPCGKGNATGATDRGITDSSITIGYGDDRGFSGSPGLSKEIGDGVKAFIKWCNDQGGINGRQLIGHYYDAKITETNNVMTKACGTDFMMVGEGFAADGTAEATRVKCNMVTAEAYSVLADFANGPMQYQGVPNPVDFTPASSYYQIAKLFPDAVKKFALLDTTLAATHQSILKDRSAMEAAGIKFAGCDVVVNYFGESDYKPFVRKLQNCGAKMIFTNITPGPVLYNFITAMHLLNYNPIFLQESNLYTQSFAAWNTNGYANNSYARIAFIPLEEANTVPAVQQYLSIVKGDGGSVSQLGEQGVSSFLMWATAAKACGSTLTRQCIVNQLSKVHNWTAGGLHAATDPGKNMPPQCGVLVRLQGTKWVRVYPSKPGTFDCSPKYLAAVPQSLWNTKLNADRIATTFLIPSVIKPQS